MIFSLNAKRNAVKKAQLTLAIANKTDKRASLDAKRKCKRLILSAKGMAVIFASGAIKGAISSKQMSAKQMLTLVGKQLMAAWLSQADHPTAQPQDSDS